MDIDLKEVVRLLKIVDSYEAKRSEIERIYENSCILPPKIEQFCH